MAPSTVLWNWPSFLLVCFNITAEFCVPDGDAVSLLLITWLASSSRLRLLLRSLVLSSRPQQMSNLPLWCPFGFLALRKFDPLLHLLPVFIYFLFLTPFTWCKHGLMYSRLEEALCRCWVVWWNVFNFFCGEKDLDISWNVQDLCCAQLFMQVFECLLVWSLVSLSV